MLLCRLQQKCDAEQDDEKRMQLKKLHRRLESVSLASTSFLDQTCASHSSNSMSLLSQHFIHAALQLSNIGY